MRVNVYAEELTDEVALVTTTGVSRAGRTEQTFYGVRFFLKSHEDLHRTPEDDDRSAVTLWLPPTVAGREGFATALREAAELAEKAGH